MLPRRPPSPRAGLVNLSSNELHHPDVVALLKEALGALQPDAVRCYPSYGELERELAEHHGVRAEELHLAAGSDDALRQVSQALAATCGRLVLQAPNYDRWDTYARLSRVATTPVRFGERTPERFDLGAFEEVLRGVEPAVVVVSNPNGPTGFTFSLDEVDRLARACRSGQHLLVVDACYAAFSELEHAQLIRQHPHLLVVQSYSKAFGLAGARIASVMGCEELIDYLARWEPRGPVSGTAIGLLRALLPRAERLRRLRRELAGWREEFCSAVSRRLAPWYTLPSGANFVNVRTRSEGEAEWVVQQLFAEGVRIRCTSPLVGLQRCWRTTVAPPAVMEDLVQKLERLKDLYERQPSLRGPP